MKKTMPDTESVSYTYNAAKQVASMTDYFGAETTYTYTGGNYISKIETPHGEVGYYYRKDGKLTDQYGEDNETIYTYDSLGRVNYIWIGNTVIGYAYDNSGNIVTKVDAGVTTNYVYDDVNRLIQEKPGSSTYSYTYDKYNNMTYAITDVDKSYSYDTNNRMTSMNIYGATENGNIYDFYYSCTYDKNGNMITKDCSVSPWSTSESPSLAYGEYTYNVWGQLTDAYIEKPASIITYNTDYTYYADGLRKSKVVNEYGNSTTTNTYNYYYHNDTVLNETKNNVNYATNIIGVTGIEARNQSGTTGFFGKDLHGDVRYAFNSSCTKIADYTYDAWGNDATSSTSTWAKDNPVRYNGQYLDSETGMYYLRARYYDPNMNRFINEDPIKDGINWYAYAGNNPVMFVDPSGLSFDEIIENLEIIYQSKNVMDTTESYTVEYREAYDDVMDAKTAIANDEDYNEETLHLNELLKVIVEGNDNSIYDIGHVINVTKDAKQNIEKEEAEKKARGFGTRVKDAAQDIKNVVTPNSAPMDVAEEMANEAYPTPTPYSGPNYVYEYDDLGDIYGDANFN